MSVSVDWLFFVGWHCTSPCSNACLLDGLLGTHEGSAKLVDQGLRALISAMGVPINEVETQIGRKNRKDGTQNGFLQGRRLSKACKMEFWSLDFGGGGDK